MTTEELRAMPLHGINGYSSQKAKIERVPGGWNYIYTEGVQYVPDPLEAAAVQIAAGIRASESNDWLVGTGDCADHAVAQARAVMAALEETK